MPKVAANLKRFKGKLQGMLEFAIVLEQADPRNRGSILQSAENEDPAFLEQALRKTVFFEELPFLDETVIAEILSKVTPKVLAFALQGTPPQFQETLLKHLAYRERHAVEEERTALKKEISDAFVLGARRQILKTARVLAEQNKFAFELADCPRFRKKR